MIDSMNNLNNGISFFALSYQCEYLAHICQNPKKRKIPNMLCRDLNLSKMHIIWNNT